MQDYRRLITSNPNILFGKPAIKDTRIAVEHILDELAGGTTIEQLLEHRSSNACLCSLLKEGGYISDENGAFDPSIPALL